jgi:hypothetical protein
LANRSHRHAVRTITPQVFDENVRSVRFRAEAVVANVDTSVCHRKPIHVQSVKAICILRQGLRYR